MEFPVDILTTVTPESLEQSAKDYMSKLLYRNSDIHEYLSIPVSKKVEIGLCNVSFVPLYGDDSKQKVLALYSPEELFKAVGLYLLDQWWSAEDILKTADSSRTGLIKVRTPGERVVLYVLNKIIYRTKEMVGDDVPFVSHGEDEIAKILWKNGEAIGFYSVKPEGRLCKSFLTQRYHLPVMDTIFIRKCHRGNGHGFQMLEDFVNHFKTDFMGLKSPLSPAMYKVCKKYLSLYPKDTELLWEIEGVGSRFQRTQIARKLQAMDLKGNHQVVAKLKFDTEDSDIPIEVRETTEYMEVVEEVVQINTTKEVQDIPVTTRSRSSNLKHKNLGAEEETEETSKKIIRVEDIEPKVQCAKDDPELKDTMEMHDVTPISEITNLHCKEQNKLISEPTHQSGTEKEQVVKISPVMEIQSFKGNEDAQIMKTFEATIVPVDLQPLNLHQVEEVEEISAETEEVKQKAGEVKEMKDSLDKVIPSDGMDTSEEIVVSQKGKTDLAEASNKEDIEDKVELGRISAVKNIVGNSEEIEVEKEEAEAQKVVLVNLNKVSTTHTDVSEDARGTSQPESADNRENKELDRFNQKIYPTEKEQEVAMTENENVKIIEIEKSSIKETAEMMETEEWGITADVDRVSELTTDEDKMEEFQEKKPLTETKTVQDTPDEEIKSKDIIESSEDDEGLKSDVQIELSEEQEDETNFETPLRRSRRLKHQVAESELTERVLRSSTKSAEVTSKTKAIKQQEKMKQLVDDHEVGQKKEALESQTETPVEEKTELVNITTETKYVKAVEIEFEGKTPGQSAAEPVEEQEEDLASKMGPAEDANTQEAISALKLQKVNVVLVDFEVLTTPTNAGKDAKGASQSQEEKYLELHKPGCTDAESQAEHTEKEQVVEMTENKCENSRTEETDEKMESEGGVVLNDENRVPESAVTDEENMEQVEKETDTAQEIPTEKPKGLHIIESSDNDDESERSDVPIKLDEEEEDAASSVTPLRRFRRLKGQAAKSELTKSVLRTSPRLSNKAISQQRHEGQVKDVMLDEAPEQSDESNNNGINIILGSEVAQGEHMESETVHVLAEGDPENMISTVQSACEEGSILEKGDLEADDDDDKSIKKSHGNEVEDNVRSDEVKEQGEMVPEDIIHGEAEQFRETSAVDIELSEIVKDVEYEVQEEGAATEMPRGEGNEKVMETASALTLQEFSVVLVDVKKVLPSLTGDCSSAFESAQEEIGDFNQLEMSEQAVEMPEEVKEGLQTEVEEGENIETDSVNPTEGDPTDLNTAAKGTAEEESNLEDETTDTSKLEEKKSSDESKVESKPEQVTLQDPISTHECSETITCVQDILNLHNTEEQVEELVTDLAPEEDRENAVKSTSMIKLHKAAVVLVDFQRQTGGNETDANETTQVQEVAFLTKANEEMALVEMDVTEPVKERIVEEAIKLGMLKTLIKIDEQDMDNLAEEGMKEDLTQVEDSTLKEKSDSKQLDTNKRCQESTTSAQGDRVQESTQDEDISVNTRRNLRLRTLPEKPTPERKSRCLQNIYKETKLSKNTEEEISDEEDKTAFSRHLKRRTIAVTPRIRSKHLTDTQDEEPEMEVNVTKVKNSEIIAVESTAEARSAVEETHETNSKCDSEEPAVSQVAESDGGKDMVEVVDHNEVETTERVESGLLDKNQEKEEPDEPNQEQLRSSNAKQESDQQDNALEEALPEKTFEEEPTKRVEEKHFEEEKDNTMDTSITEVLDQSEGGVSVERRTLRRRTITIKASSVRKPKRLRKQDQGENTNATDGAISHMAQEAQENAEGEETYINSQDSTITEDMSKQPQLTEFLNTSEGDIDPKLVAKEEETESNVNVDENFTLELDEEIDNNDAECTQAGEETKASFQESEKEITDTEQEAGVLTKHILRGRKSATASPEQRSTRRSRRWLQDSHNEMEDKSEVTGREEKKPQQKRKAIDELTPRRSKRLARAEIV